MKMKKFNNRKTANLGKNDFLIVHEGVQNYDDIQIEIKENIKYLQEILESSAHLSDIGIKMSFIVKNLDDTCKKCFEKHKIEQGLTLEEFNNLHPLS